jgi:hypothetical protein
MSPKIITALAMTATMATTGVAELLADTSIDVRIRCEETAAECKDGVCPLPTGGEYAVFSPVPETADAVCARRRRRDHASRRRRWESRP